MTEGLTSNGALAALEEAERKIIAALEAASSAFRALAAAESSRAASFDAHSETFLRDLASAQGLIMEQISRLGPDLPLENSTMRNLIQADLSAQQTMHAHRAVARALSFVSTSLSTDNGTSAPRDSPELEKLEDEEMTVVLAKDEPILV